jgi:hypothetical protein
MRHGDRRAPSRIHQCDLPHGHEQGLVLVRSQWRATVTLADWKPEFEASQRRTVPAHEWRTHIPLVDTWEPIFERFFAEAGLT